MRTDPGGQWRQVWEWLKTIPARDWPKAIPGILGYLLFMATILAVPAWIVYSLVAPLFGPEPVSAYLAIAKGAGMFVVGVVALFGLIAGFVYFYQRFRYFRLIAKGAGVVLLALVVVSKFDRCSHSPRDCTPSRYVVC